MGIGWRRNRRLTDQTLMIIYNGDRCVMGDVPEEDTLLYFFYYRKKSIPAGNVPIFSLLTDFDEPDRFYGLLSKQQKSS